MDQISNENEQPKAKRIEFIDKRNIPFAVIDKRIIWQWIPFIGEQGFTLYCIYVSLVNKDKGYAFPSLNRLSKFLGIGKSTVSKYNSVLQEYKLIDIQHGFDESGAQINTRYYILDVPPLPKDLKNKLKDRSLVSDTDNSDIPEGGFTYRTGGSPTEPGVHVQDRGVHMQDRGVHVQDPKETNFKEKKTNKIVCVSAHARNIFVLGAPISEKVLQSLTEVYSEEKVLGTIALLEETYAGRENTINNPIGLLKSALKEGYEEITRAKEDSSGRSSEISDQHRRKGQQTKDSSWDNILQ
jgi:hypothetical protein